jgi:hypothetical protein
MLRLDSRKIHAVKRVDPEFLGEDGAGAFFFNLYLASLGNLILVWKPRLYPKPRIGFTSNASLDAGNQYFAY